MIFPALTDTAWLYITKLRQYNGDDDVANQINDAHFVGHKHTKALSQQQRRIQAERSMHIAPYMHATKYINE